MADFDRPPPDHIIGNDPTPDLNKAVALVLAASDDSIPKRGYNDFHKYYYATADDIRLHVARLLGAQGLSYAQHEAGFTHMGSLTAVTYYFVVHHESGQTAPPEKVSVFMQIVSSKGVADDKALSKASVQALKTWAKSRFSIATGDQAEDPDMSEPLDNRPAPKQARATKQDGGAHEAFRNAGLPPKVTNETNGAHRPIDLAATLDLLENEADSRTWMLILENAWATCQSFDDRRQIRMARRVELALQKAKPETKKRIEGWYRSSGQRLAEQSFPGDPMPEDDWSGPVRGDVESVREATSP